MQSILLFEHLKTLYVNPGTPFLLKLELLKLMFYPFIAQNNQNVTSSDVHNMLSTTVLSDLMLFTRYLEGLIRQGKGSDKEMFENARNSLIHLKTIVFISDMVEQP